MPLLSALICPRCGSAIEGVSANETESAGGFDDCLRRCEPCGIGASNARGEVTFIYRDPLANIPVECREGATEALRHAHNENNRANKWRKFGFSTSEDAITWTVFKHLLDSERLLPAFKRVGWIDPAGRTPTLLLWGSPVGGPGGERIRQELSALCTSLGEDPKSFSEPDVIVDFGKAGLVFIEVKHRSPNELKPDDYRGWPKYLPAAWVNWRGDDVKASGCYELARNWCLLRGLAGDRPCTLVNLGPAQLFRGDKAKNLDRFIAALDTDPTVRFEKVLWSNFLAPVLDGAPAWLSEFCRTRKLTA